MKPYIYLEEALAKKEPGKSGYKLLTEEQGCVAGCCSGVTVNSNTEYSGFPAHEDQEGFYVLEGEGMAWLDGEEFPIYPGTSFIAAAGVKHAVKCNNPDNPVKVLWFHSAI